MLTIRFSRVGKKNKAQYKLVLQEKTAAPTGRHVEILGSHDPHLKQTVLKEDRIKYWLEKGAQASDTVYNLLVSKGIISDKKRPVKMPAKKAEEVVEGEAPKEGEAKAEEAPKEEIKAGEVPKEEAKAEEKKEEASKEEKKEETKAEEAKPAAA